MIQKQQLIQHEAFIIFGAGNTGKKVHRILNSIGKRTSYFLVSTTPQQEFTATGIPIYSLEAHSSSEEVNTPVIIAIFNREKESSIPAITSQLRAKGYSLIINYFEFHAIFAEEIGDVFWLTKPSFFQQNKTYFADCLKLFKEEKSTMLYGEILHFLDTFNPEVLSKPDMENQYFPDDLHIWDGTNAFVDIGAYDGQNIIDASNKVGILSQVVAFEPDLKNFERISRISDWHTITKQAILFPCGVWSETRTLHFTSDNGESSAVLNEGTGVVTVVALDDILKGIIPGFIKMDIEGAELEALYGAKNIITRYKPSLALSIYHNPSHLFEIALLINSWNLGYKFTLRFHGHNLFDTVLYCSI